MKRRILSTTLILVGIFCIIAAGGLTGYNIWLDRNALEVSRKYLTAVDDKIEAQEIIEGDEMPEIDIDGERFFAVIYLPVHQVSAAVMTEYDFQAMTENLVRFSGSYLTDDLVICGHNYNSCFGQLLHCAIGEEIMLKTATGRILRYVVSNVEQVHPTEVERMINNRLNPDGGTGWDLTLFTCNVDGTVRIAVRCVLQ